MEKLNLDRISLKKFGITMGVVFFIITLFVLLKHKHNVFPTTIISGIFFISAFMSPILLKPVYILWMKLAFALGWLNTRLILLIIFYVIFAPVGLVLRLFRVDLLDRKINKGKESYWLKKERKEFNPLDYERQF